MLSSLAGLHDDLPLVEIALPAAHVNGAIGYGFSTMAVPIAVPEPAGAPPTPCVRRKLGRYARPSEAAARLPAGSAAKACRDSP